MQSFNLGGWGVSSKNGFIPQHINEDNLEEIIFTTDHVKIRCESAELENGKIYSKTYRFDEEKEISAKEILDLISKYYYSHILKTINETNDKLKEILIDDELHHRCITGFNYDPETFEVNPEFDT